VGRPPAPGSYAYLVQPAGADGTDTRTDTWVVTASGPESWDLTASVAPGWSATSTLRLGDDAIELTSWTLRHGERATTIRPLTAVPDLVLPASPGTSWDVTGYDLSAGVSVRSSGRYLERQAVPLCGALVDTWKVETTLVVTPLPVVGSDAPSVTITAKRWVATQHGALVARVAQRIDAALDGARTTVEGTWHLRRLDPT
jgi:hypothetical protein